MSVPQKRTGLRRDPEKYRVWWKARYQRLKPGLQSKARQIRKRDRLEAPWKFVLDSVRARAKDKGLLCDLTRDWVVAKWTGKCELTGLPFKPPAHNGPNPFSPSIDRIDSTCGYVQGNCRIVLFAVNALKASGTDDQMFEIAERLTAFRKQYYPGAPYREA